ncbi:hypothetical protein ACOZB2_28090, partial [Pantoea endophytica]
LMKVREAIRIINLNRDPALLGSRRAARKEMTEFHNVAIAYANPAFFDINNRVPSLKIALAFACFTLFICVQ